MTGEPSVSVVIPSIGRNTLRTAVESVLNQTAPAQEIIIVLDRDCEPDLPDSDAIMVVKTLGEVGPANARQLGAETASSDLIALLDDDDVWLPDKLRQQLAIAPAGDRWMVSSRVVTHRPTGSSTYPRKLIGPTQSVSDYLFSFHGLRFGGASLQTSTLVFPRSVAMAVPMSLAAGSVHDDPLWLMAVRRALPDLRIIQSPEVLVEYGLTEESLSRSTDDRSDEYMQWGLDHLTQESPRVRGDYLMTSPIAASVAAGSLLGAIKTIWVAGRAGRPGVGAWLYAFAGVARISLAHILALVKRAKQLWNR